MCSTDVPPNRLSVAQEAALAFIGELEPGTQIGLVAFAGFAEIIVPPTNDILVLENAIINLTTARGTAIGSATLKSIDAIAEINTAVSQSGLNLQPVAGDAPPTPEIYEPEIIVLLTDGANSQGPLPLDAAQQAADRRLRVYTIGFGTPEGGAMVCTQQQLGSDAFGDGFGRFGGGSFSANFRRLLVIDEPTLLAVAETTGGEYFRAESADQLNEVFRDLPSQIIVQKEQLEISVLFTILGMLLAAMAVGLSLLWNRYP
jgi:Ca-activated chloride channel family protein